VLRSRTLGTADVGNALWTCAGGGAPSLRERAIAVLVQRKDQRTLPIVTRNLTSGSWQTRITAVNQMAMLAPPEVVNLLLPLLKDGDLRVRAVAVERLGEAASRSTKGSPEEKRVVLALEAMQRDALQEVDRRVKAYQDSRDVLRIVDCTREAMAAIAAKRKDPSSFQR
jgi:HEAT repeat protein